MVLTGILARTTLQVGPVRSAGTLPVQVVTGATCAPGAASCTGGGPERFFGGFDGILGLSPQSGRELANPFVALGPSGRAFVVHADPARPELVLGAPADGFALEHLRPVPSTAQPETPDGGRPPSWTSTVPACFRSPLLPAGGVCDDVLIDTGDPSAGTVHSATPAVTVPAGSVVTIAAPDGTWVTSVTTRRDGGVSTSPDAREAPLGRGLVGLPALAHLDVRYDLAAGTIGFRSTTS